MPNWCTNGMTLHGPADQVKAIVDAVRPVEDENGYRVKDSQKELTFTKFMPQPKDEAGELLGSTSWQYENWGTKWGDCDTDISYEEYDANGTGSASLHYNTAWGPMTGLVKEISRLHPDVTIDIEYEEPGMNFFGVEQFKSGDVIYERHHEYDFSTGVIKLEDGWEMNFDTDWDAEDQDPAGTLNEAIFSAMEHFWMQKGLVGPDAPKDDGTVSS